MDALISQVKHEAISVDEAGRQKILDGLRDLAMSIETPEDSMQRIMFLHLQNAVVRVGIDIKLFNLLSESDDPLSLDQLTKSTGADPTLLVSTFASSSFEVPWVFRNYQRDGQE